MFLLIALIVSEFRSGETFGSSQTLNDSSMSGDPSAKDESGHANKMPSSVGDGDSQSVVFSDANRDWDESEMSESHRAWLAKQREYSRVAANRRKRQFEHEQLLLSRKDWIDNYPFEPTYHPDIVFSQEKLDENRRESESLESRDIDPNDFLLRPGNQQDHLMEMIKAQEESTREYNAEIERLSKYPTMIANHSYLKSFYKSQMGYTEEFEMMHRIVDEFGYGENTIMQLYLFYALMRYNTELHYHPDEISPYGYPWGERQNTNWEMIRAHIVVYDAFLNGEPKPSRDEAEEMRVRMVNEIPGDGFFDMEERFGIVAVNSRYEEELEDGDPLLYR